MVFIKNNQSGHFKSFICFWSNFSNLNVFTSRILILYNTIEFERYIIRECKMAGLKAARTRGRISGRLKINKKKLRQTIALYYSKRFSRNVIH